MTQQEVELIVARGRVRAWFREQVLESIKPLEAGKRRPVHQEIAMNQPWSDRRQNWKEQGL